MQRSELSGGEICLHRYAVPSALLRLGHRPLASMIPLDASFTLVLVKVDWLEKLTVECTVV